MKRFFFFARVHLIFYGTSLKSLDDSIILLGKNIKNALGWHFRSASFFFFACIVSKLEQKKVNDFGKRARTFFLRGEGKASSESK